MYLQISAIRVTRTVNPSTEDISRVKLNTNEEEPISVVKARMGSGMHYYYLNERNEVIRLKIANPLYKSEYVLSEDFDGTCDNLLCLPRF